MGRLNWQSGLAYLVSLFGRPGLYVVRMGNDADTERTFSSYNAALLYAIMQLSGAMTESHSGPHSTNVVNPFLTNQAVP